MGASKSTSLRKMPFSKPSPLGREDAERYASGADPDAAEGSNPFRSLHTWHNLACACFPGWDAIVPKLLTPRHGLSTPSSFRYGVDYPKPVIQPVSLTSTERTEAKVRWARARAQVQ